MGNLVEELLPEHRVIAIAEGCQYHEHKAMTEDGICLLCEKIEAERPIDASSGE